MVRLLDELVNVCRPLATLPIRLSDSAILSCRTAGSRAHQKKAVGVCLKAPAAGNWTLGTASN